MLHFLVLTLKKIVRLLINFVVTSYIFHVINSKAAIRLVLRFSDLHNIYFTMNSKKHYFLWKKNFQKSIINLHVDKFSLYDLCIGSEKALRIFFSIFQPKTTILIKFVAQNFWKKKKCRPFDWNLTPPLTENLFL